MKHILSSTALVIALSMTPSLAAANSFNGQDAHERCKSDEDNRQVLGGLAGAVAGGVLGSQVSGNGARTEGSAIGAVLGGLAGVGLADKSIDCDPVFDTPNTVYAPPQQPQQYGSTTYQNAPNYTGPQTSSGTQSYGSAQTYGTPTYSGAQTTYTTPQPVYEDRITVSNHPVYSNPTYGAVGLSQGSPYSSGTGAYPPADNNSQYASQTHQGAQVYQASTPPVYRQAPVYQQAPVYRQAPVYSQTPRYSQTSRPVPVRTQRTIYQPAPQPVYRTGHQNTHRHGRHSCDMVH